MHLLNWLFYFLKFIFLFIKMIFLTNHWINFLTRIIFVKIFTSICFIQVHLILFNLFLSLSHKILLNLKISFLNLIWLFKSNNQVLENSNHFIHIPLLLDLYFLILIIYYFLLKSRRHMSMLFKYLETFLDSQHLYKTMQILILLYHLYLIH